MAAPYAYPRINKKLLLGEFKMDNKNNFVAYEYKNITVRRDAVTTYTDCLSSFGWVPVDEQEYGFQPLFTAFTPISSSVGTTAEQELVSLKFKRDRRINNKLEIDRLERKCEEALATINCMERKNNAFTMGISLGAGIVGTAILGIAVYSIVSSNIVVGVLMAALGVAGWGAGFFANRRLGKKKSTQAEPMIQAQLEVAYGACEQAYALLA